MFWASGIIGDSFSKNLGEYFFSHSLQQINATKKGANNYTFKEVITHPCQ